MVDEDGNEVEEIVATKGMFVGKFYLKLSSEKIKDSSIYPDLPSGMYFNKYDGWFHGVPTVLSEKIDYFISVNTTLGNTANCTISLAIEACPYGSVKRMRVSRVGNITLSDNDKTVFQGVSEHEYQYFCLPEKEYQYSVTCMDVSLQHCMFIFVDEDNHFFLVKRFLLGTTISGTVMLAETRPPSLLIQPIVTTKAIHYRCEGVQHSTWVEGVDGIRVDASEGILDFSNVPSGVYNLQLVSNNTVGIDRLNFTLAVNECPTNMIQLHVYHNRAFEFLDFYQDDQMIYGTLESFTSTIDAALCIQSGARYHFHTYGFNGRMWAEQNPLYIQDSFGTIAEFRSSLVEEERNFYYLLAVPPKSKILFTKKTPEENWAMPRYKAKWSEGVSNEWGDYESNKHVYFRKTFNLASVDHYSFFYVDVSTDDLASIYVNGIEAVKLLQVNNTHHQRVRLPQSILKEGENVIAVDLMLNPSKVNATSIFFDFNLFMVSSQSIQVSGDGFAMSHQPGIDEEHTVQNAFDFNEKTYWNVTGYPASVDYFFPQSQKLVVNSLMIHQSYNDTPSSLRIEGIQDDNATVVLYSHKSRVFMTENLYEYITFNNTQRYHGYRIVFEDSVNHIPIGLCDIRLMYKEPLVCNKRFMLDEAPVGTVIYKNCPIYQVGKKQLQCVEQDYSPVWVDDRTACVSRYPRKPNSFVLSTVTLRGVSSQHFKDIEEKLVELITKNVIVLKEDISFVMLKDLSTSEYNSVQITILFIVDYRIGDYIDYYLKEKFSPKFASLVFEYLGPKYDGYVDGEPKLINPINWVTLLIVLLILLLLVSLITIYVLIRGKSTKNPKKLNRKLTKKQNKTEEKQVLLEDVQ